MATTPKYDLDTVDYGTTGWDLILQGLAEDVDNFLHTRILAVLGESISAFDPVYIAVNGKYYKASAQAGKVPCHGIAIEAGNEDDTIRICRLGPLPITGQTFNPPSAIYLGENGELSETRPRAFAQRIGQAYDTDKIFVWIQELSPIHYGTAPPPSSVTNYYDGIVYYQVATTTTTNSTTTTTTTV